MIILTAVSEVRSSHQSTETIIIVLSENTANLLFLILKRIFGLFI